VSLCVRKEIECECVWGECEFVCEERDRESVSVWGERVWV